MKKMFLSLGGIIAFLALTLVLPVNAATPDDLVGWWKLNENSGAPSAEDSSNYDNDGDYNAVGLNGSEGDFNGSTSYVKIDDDVELDINGEITIEAWIKPDQINQYNTIVSKRENSASNYSFRLWNGKLEFYYRSQVDAKWSEWSTTNQVIFNDGKWYHVAVSYKYNDDSSLRMYVNETSVSGNWVYTDGIESVTPNDFDLYIGYNYPSYPQAFNGLIKDVRIWKKALSEDELEDYDGDNVENEKDLCDWTLADASLNLETEDNLLDYKATNFDDYNDLFVDWGQNRWLWTEDRWKQKFSNPKKGTNYKSGTQETYGCSCLQILGMLKEEGLGNFGGHYKFGCSSSVVEDFSKDMNDGVLDGRYLIEEAITVPASGGEKKSTYPLVSGINYILKAYNTADAQKQTPHIWFDAECSNNVGISSNWVDGVEGYSSYGLDLLDLKVNGNFVDWGACDSINHTYYQNLVGDGNLLKLNIYDVYYPNNEGSLYVDIYAEL